MFDQIRINIMAVVLRDPTLGDYHQIQGTSDHHGSRDFDPS